MCPYDNVKRSIFEEINKLEIEYTRIKDEIAIEESHNVKLTVGQVKFFLVQLRRGNISDIKYKRVLINTLINKVYLYDDNIIIVFNTQDKPLEKKIPRIEVLESSFFEPQALTLRFSRTNVFVYIRLGTKVSSFYNLGELWKI